MKEFMLFVRNEGDPFAALPENKQQSHIEKVGNYITGLAQQEKMKAAQPLEMQGTIIWKEDGKFVDAPYNENKEVISGYYHILAENMEEATKIAKADPRFEDGAWRIEIRPIMKVDGIN